MDTASGTRSPRIASEAMRCSSMSWNVDSSARPAPIKVKTPRTLRRVTWQSMRRGSGCAGTVRAHTWPGGGGLFNHGLYLGAPRSGQWQARQPHALGAAAHNLLRELD